MRSNANTGQSVSHPLDAVTDSALAKSRFAAPEVVLSFSQSVFNVS